MRSVQYRDQGIRNNTWVEIAEELHITGMKWTKAYEDLSVKIPEYFFDSRSDTFKNVADIEEQPQQPNLPNYPETELTPAELFSEILGNNPKAEAALIQDPEEVVSKDDVHRMYAAEVRRPVGVAAIMALATCGIVGSAYTGLIVWRRIYMQRNGLKHDLLRNEEGPSDIILEINSEH